MSTLTKKLCSYALNGNCHFDNDKCANYHPANVTDAKNAYAAMGDKRSLNICKYYPGCTNPGCTFLHTAVAPKAASSYITPLPPADMSPRFRLIVDNPASCPAKINLTRAKTVPRAKAGSRAKTASHRDEPETIRVLHRLYGKISALNRALDAYQTLATTLGVPEAAEKVGLAQKRQAEILATLLRLGKEIDEYLLELGEVTPAADHEETPDGHEDTPDGLVAAVGPNDLHLPNATL